MVAVDVDVEKTVVSADLLQLRIGGEQRAPVPEPDVVDGPAVLCERLKGEILRRGERFHRDRAEIASLPGEIDVNVWPFRLQLARFDIETLDERVRRVAEDEGAANTMSAAARTSGAERSRMLANAAAAAMRASATSSPSAGISTWTSEDELPPVALAPGDQQSEYDRGAQDDESPPGRGRLDLARLRPGPLRGQKGHDTWREHGRQFERRP